MSALAEARDFKIGKRLEFAKAHNKIQRRRKSGACSGLEELPKILGFPFNISAMAEATDFEIGMELGFAKAYNKIQPGRKIWVWPWAKGAPKNSGVSLSYFCNG